MTPYSGFVNQLLFPVTAEPHVGHCAVKIGEEGVNLDLFVNDKILQSLLELGFATRRVVNVKYDAESTITEVMIDVGYPHDR